MTTESEQVRILRENELLRLEFSQAEVRVKALEEVKAAARIITDVAKAAGPYQEHKSCPHGNAPVYPSHGRWCDECFTRLEAALAAPSREGDADCCPDCALKAKVVAPVGEEGDMADYVQDCGCPARPLHARVKQLEEAAALAHTELEKVERYFVQRAKAQSTSKEEALIRSVFSEPYMAVVKAQAVLAEGDADGELKPEVEARLRESLSTPREGLLTADEMRQKLAEEGDADATD